MTNFQPSHGKLTCRYHVVIIVMPGLHPITTALFKALLAKLSTAQASRRHCECTICRRCCRNRALTFAASIAFHDREEQTYQMGDGIPIALDFRSQTRRDFAQTALSSKEPVRLGVKPWTNVRNQAQHHFRPRARNAVVQAIPPEPALIRL